MEEQFNFQKLNVYHASLEFVKDIYTLLKQFPAEERYALCDQMHRAVVSIPSNIAEGMGRLSDKERIRFIEISYGSLMEIICQLDVAQNLNYLNVEEKDVLIQKAKDIAKMLSGLRTSLLKRS